MGRYDNDYISYNKSLNIKNYYNDFIPIKNYGNIYTPTVFTESEKELIEKFILDAFSKYSGQELIELNKGTNNLRYGETDFLSVTNNDYKEALRSYDLKSEKLVTKLS